METIVNVIPNGKWLTIEAHNNYCFIRVAEPNNHIILRLLKTNLKLWIKTAGELIRNKFNK